MFLIVLFVGVAGVGKTRGEFALLSTFLTVIVVGGYWWKEEVAYENVPAENVARAILGIQGGCEVRQSTANSQLISGKGDTPCTTLEKKTKAIGKKRRNPNSIQRKSEN